MSSQRPLVSIIVTLGQRRERAMRMLDSLIGQDGIEAVEIVMADNSSHPPLITPDSKALRVKVLPCGVRQHLGEMRTAACHVAEGRVVAFVEDHVRLEAGWLKALIGAVEAGHSAIGPSVGNANPGVGVSDAVHRLHYGRWDHPVEPDPINLIPGNNSAYLRSVLDQFGDDLPGLLLTDSVLQMKLAELGTRLTLEPGMRIRHLNAARLPDALRSEYLYHRCFAFRRRQNLNWNVWRKSVQAVRSIASPLVRLVRIAGGGIGNRHLTTSQHLRELLILFMLLLSAMAGNLLGLVRDDREASVQFTQFELNYPRPQGPSSSRAQRTIFG